MSLVCQLFPALSQLYLVERRDGVDSQFHLVWARTLLVIGHSLIAWDGVWR